MGPSISAILAAIMAILIFLVMGLLVAWGLQRGYSGDGVALRAMLVMGGLAVNVMAALILAVAATRGRNVWLVVRIWIVMAALVAAAMSVWVLVNDPGDAFWMVPPLAMFAVFSIFGLRKAGTVSGGMGT